MACPFFMPQRPLQSDAWSCPPRVPLGSEYWGICRARADEFYTPSEEQQRDACNWGYVRGRCDRFPQDAEVEAVRFSWAGDVLVCILEKDHVPVRWGSFENADEVLAAQRRAFLAAGRGPTTGARGQRPGASSLPDGGGVEDQGA